MSQEALWWHDFFNAAVGFAEFLGWVAAYLAIGMALQFVILKFMKWKYKEQSYPWPAFFCLTIFWPIMLVVGPFVLGFIYMAKVIQKATGVEFDG